MSAMSHYLESGLIGYIFKDLAFNPPTGIYIGLVGNYNSGSLESGLFTQELSGGGYARVSGGLGTSKWAAPAPARGGFLRGFLRRGGPAGATPGAT